MKPGDRRRRDRTPVIGHEPYRMRERRADQILERIGDYAWRFSDSGERTLRLMIPAGEDPRCCYSEWTIDHPNSGGHSWSWNKDAERPTLTPSLHAVGIWHGFVRDGQLVEHRPKS